MKPATAPTAILLIAIMMLMFFCVGELRCQETIKIFGSDFYKKPQLDGWSVGHTVKGFGQCMVLDLAINNDEVIAVGSLLLSFAYEYASGLQILGKGHDIAGDFGDLGRDTIGVIYWYICKKLYRLTKRLYMIKDKNGARVGVIIPL